MKTGKIMLGLAVAAALTAAGSGAAARTEDWRRIGQDGPLEVAVDVGSFSGPRTQRAARMAMVSLEESPVSYMTVVVRVDCEARTISAVSGAAHDADGSVLGEGALEPDTTPVDEAAATLTLAKAVCDGAAIDGRAFESAKAFAAWAATQSVEP